MCSRLNGKEHQIFRVAVGAGLIHSIFIGQPYMFETECKFRGQVALAVGLNHSIFIGQPYVLGGPAGPAPFADIAKQWCVT